MLDRKDGPIADVLDATRNLTPLSARTVERSNSEAFLKNQLEMKNLADEIARAAGERSGVGLVNKTLEWAERTALSPRVDIGLGGVHLPEPEVVGARNQGEATVQLRERCWQRMDIYLGDKLAKERLEEELSVVNRLGYETY